MVVVNRQFLFLVAFYSWESFTCAHVSMCFSTKIL